MKKVPTLFERDWDGDRSRVVDQVNPACQWVIDGEGVPYKKLDGTCCLARGGKLYKRREVKKGKPDPEGFELVEADETTGKRVGWVAVGDGPEDRWYRDGLKDYRLPDNTYELVGPKVQGNPEGYPVHDLIAHNAPLLRWPAHVPTSYAELREWLSDKPVEGIVWHHPDGRMAKIKGRDFGLKRPLPGFGIDA